MESLIAAAARISTVKEHRQETFSRLVLAIGIGIALSTVGLVMLVQRPLPFADQWDNLVSGRDVTWSWLTSQQNEHRLLLPRLIFLADGFWDHESNVIDLAANLIIQGIIAIIMIRLSKNVGLITATEIQWSVGLTLAFLFSAVQSENFTWGFQVQFLGLGLITVATFTTLVLAPPTLAYLAVVMMLEAMGIYTLAGGVLIAVLTVPLCLWLHRPWYHTVLLTAVGVGLISIYLIGYSKPEGHADPIGALLHFDRVAVYALTELGNPLWALLFQQSPAPAFVLGLIGLLLFGLVGHNIYRDRERQSGLVLFLIASFVVAMNVLTGLGRWTFGAEQALSSRYASPALLFWLALILLATSQLRRFAPRSRTLVTGTGLVIAVLFAVKQPRYILGSVLADLDRQAAVPAVLAGVADPGMMDRLLAPKERFFAARAMLKQGHGSVFALPEADWLGRLLPGGSAAVLVSTCVGQYFFAEHLSDPDHPGWRASGTLNGNAAALSNRMIFVQEGGRVVGFGRSGFMARAVTPEQPGSPPRLILWLQEVIRGERSNRWIGAFEDVDPTLVKAYVLGTDGTPVCSLGVAGTLLR